MDCPSSGDKRRSRRIAVVSNKTQDTLSLSFLLQRFDYEVSVANTAAQALELVSSYRPALVITEVVLPGMSGLDLLQLLKQDARTKSLPVVFMVPLTDAGTESRCLGMGAAGCVTKPIQVEELYRTIQEIIEPRPRANIRIAARLAVTVDDLPLDGGNSQSDVDLSEYGMYVPTSQPLPRNKRISVQIHLNDRTIKAVGCVLFSRPAAEGSPGKPGMGLKFITMAPQDQAFIRSFIRDRVTHGIALRASTWS